MEATGATLPTEPQVPIEKEGHYQADTFRGEQVHGEDETAGFSDSGAPTAQ